MPPVKIYSVYYKHYPLYPQVPFIIPIQAGVEETEVHLEMIGDNTGDNISARNAIYSELTALYWIIKNAKRDTDAFGLNHYRRYLIHDQYKLFFTKRSRYYAKASQKSINTLVTPALEQLYEQLLSENDVILPRSDFALKQHGTAYTIETAYQRVHIKKDWDITMKIVLEKYPEYAASVKALSRQTKMVFNNIMIAPWSIWDEYAGWLFDILFEVEKQIDLPKHGYQKRVMGFLAERLLNLFIIHKDLKTAHLTMGMF